MQAFMAGTGIAAGATALSFALAVWGFGNLYYASVFMPFAMLAFLAVAWFSFLRDDGFARRLPESGLLATGATDRNAEPAEPRPAESLMVAGLGAGPDDAGFGGGPVAGSATGRLDPALFAPRDGSLVGVYVESAGHRPGSLGRAALLWAALELGAVSAILYSVAGLGSTFYQ